MTNVSLCYRPAPAGASAQLLRWYILVLLAVLGVFIAFLGAFFLLREAARLHHDKLAHDQLVVGGGTMASSFFLLLQRSWEDLGGTTAADGDSSTTSQEEFILRRTSSSRPAYFSKKHLDYKYRGQKNKNVLSWEGLRQESADTSRRERVEEDQTPVPVGRKMKHFLWAEPPSAFLEELGGDEEGVDRDDPLFD